ncbi:MAG: hypothetical protein L3J16_07455 [Anaerolineales bacterium]|nr:hypothetical protein [Anaerolineales bacterium]
MEKKTVGIIATVGTTFVCACPSLFLCAWGIAGIAGMPITTTVGNQQNVAPMNISLAIGLLCLSLIGLAVPVAVGFFTLRKKPEDAAINAEPVVTMPDEPLPPAS